MGTSGDKIVLLDGMGSGSGSAANGLLSMIPGMFTSLLGGNKMDPNLVAALMNGRNNQVSKELARDAADKMLNADGSKRRWTMEDAKQMFDKCGAKKPDNATWGDVQYLFAMFYSDYFPKVLDCDQKIVKAVLAYLEDPDAPEGTAFVRYLAVRCFVGDTIKWSEMI